MLNKSGHYYIKLLINSMFIKKFVFVVDQIMHTLMLYQSFRKLNVCALLAK